MTWTILSSPNNKEESEQLIVSLSGSVFVKRKLDHSTCSAQHSCSEICLGSTPVSQTRTWLTEIFRSLTGIGSGVSVWVKEGMGASCPLEWPSHATTLHTSRTPLITLPPSSYQSLPSRLWFLPLSMSACSVLCTLTRALIHQGYITWEPPALIAIRCNCSALLWGGPLLCSVSKWCYTDCTDQYQSTNNITTMTWNLVSQCQKYLHTFFQCCASFEERSDWIHYHSGTGIVCLHCLLILRENAQHRIPNTEKCHGLAEKSDQRQSSAIPDFQSKCVLVHLLGKTWATAEDGCLYDRSLNVTGNYSSWFTISPLTKWDRRSRLVHRASNNLYQAQINRTKM